MEKCKNKFLLIGIALLLASCSRMIVNVSTADLEVVHLEAEKVRDRTDAFYYASVKSLFFSNALFNDAEISSEFQAILQSSTADGTVDSKDVNGLQNTFDTNVKTKINQIKDAYREGLRLTAAKQYTVAIDWYLNAVMMADELGALVENEFDGVKGTREVFFDRIDFLRDLVREAPEKNRDNLLGDPMVSYITKTANDSIWKSTYNTTKSWTSFGNSDIAVVLTEDPDSYNNNYTIKGVRVDADKLIQSNFDLLAQSINVIASSQGLGTPADTADSYFAPTVIPALQQLPAEEHKLAMDRRVLEAYKKLIVTEILAQDLDGKTGDELKASVTHLKSLWEAYKTKMENQINPQ